MHQESTFEQELESLKNERRWSSWRRFGAVFSIVLPLAILAIMGALTFLWYMWTSHAENEVWRRIMVGGYATRVVSLPDMAQRTVPYRTVLSVPLYGTIDVRYGKVAYRTGGVYGTVREILRTGS